MEKGMGAFCAVTENGEQRRIKICLDIINWKDILSPEKKMKKESNGRI